jgi:hypothetical protein
MPGWDRGVLLRKLPAAAIDALLDVAGPQIQTPLIVVEIRQLGGALSAAGGAEQRRWAGCRLRGVRHRPAAAAAGRDRAGTGPAGAVRIRSLVDGDPCQLRRRR